MAMVLLRAQKEGSYGSYQSMGKCEKLRASPESQTLTNPSEEVSAQRKQTNRQFPDRSCSSGPARSNWNHPLLNPSYHRCLASIFLSKGRLIPKQSQLQPQEIRVMIGKLTIPLSPPPPHSPSKLLFLQHRFMPIPPRRKKNENLCKLRVYFRDPFTHIQSYRHDPDAENAVVMIVPTKEHEAKFNPRFVFLRA